MKKYVYPFTTLVALTFLAGCEPQMQKKTVEVNTPAQDSSGQEAPTQVEIKTPKNQNTSSTSVEVKE